MWAALQTLLTPTAIANDWAAFSTADGTVHADWVVTLPGQYVMTNPICDIYSNYRLSYATALLCNVLQTHYCTDAARR